MARQEMSALSTRERESESKNKVWHWVQPQWVAAGLVAPGQAIWSFQGAEISLRGNKYAFYVLFIALGTLQATQGRSLTGPVDVKHC